MDISAPPPVPARETSGWATAALVLGCGVFMLGCLTGLPALICGIVALVKINKKPGLGGSGFAIAGIIMGGLSLIFIPILAAIAIPTIASAIDRANETRDLNQIRQVGHMLTEYAQAHDGKFPESLDDLKGQSAGGEDVEKLLYEDEGHKAKWSLTPGLTLDAAPETIVLQSIETRGKGSRKGRAEYFINGVSKWVRDDGQPYTAR